LSTPVTFLHWDDDEETLHDCIGPGPQVGEQVPDFSLVDQTGRTRDLQSIMGPRGAMVVFQRSADW
jgi:hypothetical protein